MQLRHPFFALLLLITPFNALAQAVHQYGYQEVIYDTYPPDMSKTHARVQAWVENANVEVEKIMQAENPHIVAWRKAILAVPMDDDRTMLDQVNAITNKFIPYVTDYDGDYWESPIGTLLKGGDCEDIALLKAVALHMKGWSANRPQSVHVLMGLRNQNNTLVPHAVLEVDTVNDKHYVMDNMMSSVLTFDDMNLKMKPLYMVDANGVIAFVKAHHTLSSLATSAGAANGEAAPIIWEGESSPAD